MEMIDRIQKQEATGILCWKLDRLARNPIDGGSISMMLQMNMIHKIVTPEKEHLPNDNVILMAVEFGMANQYIIDLQRNVKRGMNSKIEKGWLPTKAPFGYLNDKYADKGTKTILPHPENFALLQSLWKILLRQKCSLMELYRIMKKEYPLIIKGKVIGFSSFDRIFHNPFYAGYFVWKGEWREGAHMPMITLSEYEEAQRLITNRHDLRQRTLEFGYKGILRCNHCGCMITAEEKLKRIKRTGETKPFRYYHCTRKKREILCHEKPVSESTLEEQMLSIIERVALPQEVLEFGLQAVESLCCSPVPSAEEERLQRECNALTRLITQATDTLIREEDPELSPLIRKRLQDMQLNKKRLEGMVQGLRERRNNRRASLRDTLDLVLRAKNIVEKGTTDEKKELMHGLGSNWNLQDRMLDFEPHLETEALQEANVFLLAEKSRLELNGALSTQTKKLPEELVLSVWSG